MKIGIGYRTLKTALGAALAIGTAQLFDLQFYASAGILTILCVKESRKRSLINAWERILSCILGLAVAALLFTIIGYNPWTIGIVILALIPLLLYFKAEEGLVSSAVVILHLYTLKKITLPLIFNELSLVLIGIGFALIMNLYMPNQEKLLDTYRKEIERNFQRIFSEFSRFLREGYMDWDGKEITETSQLIDTARQLAMTEVENRLNPEEDFYVRYFQMRQKQFGVIERLVGIISRLDRNCFVQGERIADFLDELSDAIHPGNTAFHYLKELQAMREEFRDSPLPQSRREFETRAALYQLVHEIRQYLIIKKELSPRYASKSDVYKPRVE
ncbi:Uncharacterized membrane protein YgaE, UPF0421/DUF939 family [Marininema mesophilum]|uniref:Uncharacterized membrane protein YgaE, UPF0421/DUF939 family n=1 Tax=Marininema mesophilum TaxID=1048340 RepID=A0A1H2X0H0_9BACL|nr:aromatic acid exporter family protein [Marininema mesophilum]SDW86268.1 Uncharacterized membrane protein YgaE, UPF0421/DUF939 family [Marininema mesophilum]